MKKLDIKKVYNDRTGAFEVCSMTPRGKFVCYVSRCLDKLDEMINNFKR